jgi:hypothetical protein
MARVEVKESNPASAQNVTCHVDEAVVDVLVNGLCVMRALTHSLVARPIHPFVLFRIRMSPKYKEILSTISSVKLSSRWASPHTHTHTRTHTHTLIGCSRRHAHGWLCQCCFILTALSPHISAFSLHSHRTSLLSHCTLTARLCFLIFSNGSTLARRLLVASMRSSTACTTRSTLPVW